jgi:hypothetical protein
MLRQTILRNPPFLEFRNNAADSMWIPTHFSHLLKTKKTQLGPFDACKERRRRKNSHVQNVCMKTVSAEFRFLNWWLINAYNFFCILKVYRFLKNILHNFWCSTLELVVSEAPTSEGVNLKAVCFFLNLLEVKFINTKTICLSLEGKKTWHYNRLKVLWFKRLRLGQGLPAIHNLFLSDTNIILNSWVLSCLTSKAFEFPISFWRLGKDALFSIEY